RRRRGGTRADRPAQRSERMGALARQIARRGASGFLSGSARHGHASRAGSVRMSQWMAYFHRFSGTVLALFLPVHFWALGRGLELEAVLAWTQQPLVTFAE